MDRKTVLIIIALLVALGCAGVACASSQVQVAAAPSPNRQAPSASTPSLFDVQWGTVTPAEVQALLDQGLISMRGIMRVRRLCIPRHYAVA